MPQYAHSYGAWSFSLPHETWGFTSYPPLSAEQLELSTHLGSVPQRGVVIDIGSGPGLSLSAAIKAIRPDAVVVGIDSGFGVEQDPREAELYIEEIIERSTPKHRPLLKADPSWHKRSVAGYAEKLPIKTGVADLVTSYAAIPEYSEDLDEALSESMRILKLGGIALFGPMMLSTYLIWEEAITDNPNVTSFERRKTEIELPSGYMAEAYFTAIKK